jgi:hypothetical protein
MLEFPLQFDDTTPRLCKSVLSSAREPAGGSFSTWAARQVFKPKCILASGFPDCVEFWQKTPPELRLSQRRGRFAVGKVTPGGAHCQEAAGVLLAGW